jgi:hypothetical protein
MANDRSKGNLAMNVGEALLERINALAYLRNESRAQLVGNLLDDETKAAWHVTQDGRSHS